MGYRAAIFVVTSSFVGCADTAIEPAADSSSSSVVAKLLSESATVYPDRLEFPKAVFPTTLRAQIAAGKERVVLIGDRAASAVDPVAHALVPSGNPYGYLRHATSYRDEGDKTVVLTEQASLEEAFSEFHDGQSFQMHSAPASGAPTPLASRTFNFTLPVIDVNHRELFAQDGLHVTLSRGYVSVDTTIDVGADVHAFSLNAAHVVLAPTVTSGLEVEVDVTGPLEKSFSTDVFQGSWPVGSIGPIPVTLGLVVSVGCDVTATGTAHVTSGIGIDVTLRGGVQYDKSAGTRPVWDRPDVEPRVTTPKVDVTGTVQPKCFVRPKIEVLLFDALGPFLTPELSATLKASRPPLQAELDGGFALDLGGELRIFGKEITGFDARLFSIEKPLWKSP